MGEVDEPLEPVDSVFASSAENDCQCLPEGRLEVVEVGENGESWPKTSDASGMCTGGEVERRWE
jgi:hypothetical protein